VEIDTPRINLPAQHPLRSIRAVVDPILNEPSLSFDSMYLKNRAPVDPAGAAAASPARADAVLDPNKLLIYGVLAAPHGSNERSFSGAVNLKRLRDPTGSRSVCGSTAVPRGQAAG
jgi:hypothetical protein